MGRNGCFFAKIFFQLCLFRYETTVSSVLKSMGTASKALGDAVMRAGFLTEAR